MYIEAVQRAMRSPGHWIKVPRRYESEFNASVTATCLRGGYLRVKVRPGDTPVDVAGKRYVKTPALVSARVEREPEGWCVSIRHD